MKPPPPPESRLSTSGISRTRDAESLPVIKMVFSDEFAPSSFEYSSPSGDKLESPLSRQLFYNSQILNTLYDATVVAKNLGFPDMGVSPGFQFIPISNEIFTQITQVGHHICPKLTEGSFEWLCVQCYLRWVTACWHFTEPVKLPVAAAKFSASPHEEYTEPQREFHRRSLDALGYASEMLRLGAACRELELTLINKRPANARRKQIKAFAHQNEGRNIANAGRANRAAEWKSVARILASQTALTGRARARWVSVKLLAEHNIRKAPQTVWAALASD